MKIRPGRTVRRMQLKLHRWASEDSARRFKRVRVRRRLQRHRDPLPLPRGEHPGPWTPPLTAAEQRARHVESRMRGDTHVRFGRRARETDSGQPGHRARARPNCPSRCSRSGPSRTRARRSPIPGNDDTMAEPGISDGRRMNRYRAASCIAAPSERLIKATNRAEGRRRRVGGTDPDTASTRRDVDVVPELTYFDGGRTRR